MERDAIIGDIHHFGLTVPDVDASTTRYQAVLGFERVGDFCAPDGSRRKVFLRHDGLHARLGLTEQRFGDKDAFDETRVGLDHLAFAVSSRAELDDWALRFAQAGVSFSPVAPPNSMPGAAVLVFRDPNNIQLELFFEPPNPDRCVARSPAHGECSSSRAVRRGGRQDVPRHGEGRQG
jgi:glyoxylase I family protein